MRTFPWTPANVDKSYLLQGFNLRGPHPWVIKSRIGVESQPLKCGLPYIVRGVGNGFHGNPQLSCGEKPTGTDTSFRPVKKDKYYEKEKMVKVNCHKMLLVFAYEALLNNTSIRDPLHIEFKKTIFIW